MPTLTQLSEFEPDPRAAAVRAAYDAGYAACYDGPERDANPYLHATGAWCDLCYDAWHHGWDTAYDEMQADMGRAEADAQEDFDSGRWTDADSRSMDAGRDLPLRNEAGEYLPG